jgi:hypothetical protein
MSEYIVWDQIHVHVAEYDWYMLTVDCCIEYTIHIQSKSASGFGQFGPHNLDGVWHK